MHPAIKVAFGALMVVLGVYSSLSYTSELVNFVQAVIGPLLILVGAFIIWLESDEWRLNMEDDSDRGFDVQQSLKPQTEDNNDKEAIKEAAQDSSDKIACPDCGKEFDTERGMKIHRTQKHA
ncbi:MAG: hypothetical protein R6V35_04810 [Candidatus Nanohaloarchaea archaeon]